MFESLQKKWKVNGWRLLLILVTFAVGGSTTGYAGKKIMTLLNIESAWLYIPTYILVITLIWPVMVVLVSIPLGQFAFFRSYIRKLGSRLTRSKREIYSPGIAHPGTPVEKNIVRLAVFASGTGSNAQKIIDHFRDHAIIKVSVIVCNKPGAGVLGIAEKESVPVLMIEKEKFLGGNGYVDELKELQINFIVLAGFLWKIPSHLIEAFPNRIINIHPALLPKYGGKGLYGSRVHEAVISAGEKHSGITIHYVDELYDHGDHIFQEKVLIEEDDTPETLAKKIQVLEHLHLPRVIEEVVLADLATKAQRRKSK